MAKKPKIVPNYKTATINKSSSVGFKLACAVIGQAVEFAQGKMKGMGFKKIQKLRYQEEAISFLSGRGAWSRPRNHWCSVAGIELSYMRRKLDELGVIKYEDFIIGVEV